MVLKKKCYQPFFDLVKHQAFPLVLKMYFINARYDRIDFWDPRELSGYGIAENCHQPFVDPIIASDVSSSVQDALFGSSIRQN
jgi:hypothetical protein